MTTTARRQQTAHEAGQAIGRVQGMLDAVELLEGAAEGYFGEPRAALLDASIQLLRRAEAALDATAVGDVEASDLADEIQVAWKHPSPHPSA
jgi:hypothetical protein